MEMVVLAIDPGRSKCGLAVVASRSGILARAVVPRSTVAESIRGFSDAFSPTAIVIGGGTGGRDVRSLVDAIPGPARVETVDEGFTSLSARDRFFRENPPRGLWRLVRVSLQIPRVPYDDYVAIILAERYISEHSELQ